MAKKSIASQGFPCVEKHNQHKVPNSFFTMARFLFPLLFLFSGHEPIYFIENKEKTLQASYDRGTQICDYLD